MKHRRHFSGLLTLVFCACSTIACSSSSEGSSNGGPVNNDAPLSDLDALLKDAPPNGKLDELGKADAVYPVKFTELLQHQAPIRSQGRRGVCSIFSTVGLMEHLYIKEGTITAPDFSEQYLQWSVKAQVGAFSWSEGSNANSNLKAINQFGIPEESAWPYEPNKWTSSNDPECDGSDSLPTKCYTNGEPPQSARDAEQFFLPRGRWINSKVRSIKAHLTSKKQAAIAGMTFFYQSWNHRSSKLKTSSDLWNQGFVPYPNQEDKTESLKKRAGHSIVLVGWDDELEVQPLDSEGNPAVNGNGEAIKEKGFFIFRNSWGTGSFGKNNPHGDGYGYLSYRYIEEYASVYASDLPTLEKPVEICNDNIDNDNNNQTDCDDSACSSDAACTGSSKTFSNTQSSNIADKSTTTSEIVISDSGKIDALSVKVDISHTYRGDLLVKLVRDGGGEVILHDREGGSADDLKKVFSVTAFDGQDMTGTWKLVVEDRAFGDSGTLNSWSMEVATCSGGTCGQNEGTYSSTSEVAIPDESPSGITSDITVPDAGTISALSVTVNIEHAAKGDLSIKLQKVGESTEAILLEPDASGGSFGSRTFSVNQFVGSQSSGDYRLLIADTLPGDVGKLTGWSMKIKR